MKGDRAVLPVTALAAVVARQGLGELHIAVQPEPVWIPPGDRPDAESAVDTALAEAGLLEGRGRVDADFLDWLPLLTNATIEYYGWLSQNDTTWSVLAAGRGLQGVLAVRSGDWVTLLPANHNRLAETLAAHLPELYPGGGSHWSVRVIDLEEAGRHPANERSLPPDVREIVKVVQRPVTGAGELYVAERDHLGRYTRLREPLHYVDTDWGRYLNYTNGSGAEAEVHIAPGSASAIATELDKLRATLG
ncbi:ESX secretion-associated protein EspG [Prauserella muralis]|uniref:Uncharacterized protein n=1 Tax=Prauserella muralis TaxID=588067 RepID=A0A2V4AYS6_9PSEU|nr:ESX secretion-associated protein EspG [Prauserella muralis]PXY21070.1 hypothetical protein BAY60_26735 [Prauserella muralis]TWE30149.1 ESAT-6 protein secretion system EspG family protein [Prauserella muralis]